jgi:hypothetical protein
MQNFWTDNWWAIPTWLLGVAGLVAALVHARRNPDTSFGKAVLFLFPVLDPESRRSAVRPLMRWLVVAIVAILVIMEIAAR